jgi:hypothetical protein
MEKCSKCTRDATHRLQGYDWMCTFHWNKLIKKLRIQRKLQKKKKSA